MRTVLLFSLSSIFLFACSTTPVHLDSLDTRTETHVLVAGEKPSPVDPFKVNITVESNGLKESIGTEIYAGKLDSTNVHFDWKEPGVCVITFTEQDDTRRKIMAVATEKRIGLREIGGE